MSAEPTSVDDASLLQDLIVAGWSDADLEWERLGEAALSALAHGCVQDACVAIRQALYLARTTFAADDARLAASLTNQAAAVAAASPGASAEIILRGAIAAWAASEALIPSVAAPRRARSSMFHLRLERLHGATYAARWREDARARLGQLRSALAGMDRAPRMIAADEAATRLAHWHRERPAGFCDARKLLGALLLLAVRVDHADRLAPSDTYAQTETSAKGDA